MLRRGRGGERTRRFSEEERILLVGYWKDYLGTKVNVETTVSNTLLLKMLPRTQFTPRILLRLKRS
jgi:hypothetical protein